MCSNRHWEGSKSPVGTAASITNTHSTSGRGVTDENCKFLVNEMPKNRRGRWQNVEVKAGKNARVNGARIANPKHDLPGREVKSEQADRQQWRPPYCYCHGFTKAMQVQTDSALTDGRLYKPVWNGRSARPMS